MFVSRIKTYGAVQFAISETATIRIARMRQDVGVSWYCWSLLLSCIMTIAMIIIITLQPRTEGCQIGRQQPSGVQECRGGNIKCLVLRQYDSCHTNGRVADYLQHAECIKEKSTTEVYCGSHYSRLVDMVKGVAPSTQRELCCSHRAFKVRLNYFF